ncbi:MAG: DUF501 domain-containing protein [Synergistaceae bacterium]|nr:DUF501 domain-containing protein [Synergistaceae bacterium]
MGPFTKKDMGCLERSGVWGRCSAEIITGVARRCRHGAPQVLACAAEKRGRPFPTAFWLVCPHLVRVSGQLESQNGVSGLEEALAGKARQWRCYHLFHVILRLASVARIRKVFLRCYRPGQYRSMRRGGVGGIGVSRGPGPWPISAKCVHLQVASYLGTGAHPAREWLTDMIPVWECSNGLCAAK